MVIFFKKYFILQCLNTFSLDKLTKSVARIICGVNWGSTVLLNKEKGIFITNTHVVASLHRQRLVFDLI